MVQTHWNIGKRQFKGKPISSGQELSKYKDLMTKTGNMKTTPKERYIKMYNSVAATESNLAWSSGFLTKEGWLRPAEEGTKPVEYGNRHIFLKTIPTMVSPLQPNQG